jgi:DNA-binding HxlR family transcriptional regulator
MLPLTAPSLCPRFHHAVELIGKRWNGAIIRVLQQGGARFNVIAASVPELSDRMLVERLRELEHEGLVTRLVIPESPVRVEYSLTEKGAALEAAFRAIADWAETWLGSTPPEMPGESAEATPVGQGSGDPGD